MTKQLHLRLPDHLHGLVADAASESDQTIGFWVMDAVKQALTRAGVPLAAPTTPVHNTQIHICFDTPDTLDPLDA